jgi:glycosyltransferase involved in cell wall biosynthesis
MNVLHVIPSIDPRSGGPSRVIPVLGQIVVDVEGKAAVAFGYSGSGKDPYAASLESEYPKVRFFSFPFSFPSRFSRSAAFDAWLKKHVRDYDVLHIHSIYSFIVLDAVRIAVAAGVPYILRPHGSLDPFDLRKKRAVKYALAAPIVRWCLEHAAFVHCTSEMELKNMEKFGAVTHDRVIPLPVDGRRLQGDRKRFRRRFGVSEDDFVFLFLSRIDYKKGLDLLIPAFSEIRKLHSGVKLVLAGTGAYEKRVRALIDEYRFREEVIFAGFLTGQDKADALAGSDCFVLPSQNESFGVAVVEALQSGLPVLISKNVYIYEQVVRLNAGWTCEYSIESLAEAMRRILGDQKDYRSKKRSSVNAGDFYTTRNLARTYKEFYEAVANSR